MEYPDRFCPIDFRGFPGVMAHVDLFDTFDGLDYDFSLVFEVNEDVCYCLQNPPHDSSETDQPEYCP